MTAGGSLGFIDLPASEGRGDRVICRRGAGDGDTRRLQTGPAERAAARRGRGLEVAGEWRLRLGQGQHRWAVFDQFALKIREVTGHSCKPHERLWGVISPFTQSSDLIR